MDQIIKFISEKLGVTEQVARDAAKVVLQFAQKQAAGTDFEKYLARIPGAAALLAEAPPSGGGSNALGGLLGGLIGGEGGKALAGLQAAGLDLSQVGPFFQAFVEKSREVAGPETVDEILNKVPVLQSLLKK